MTNQAKKQMRAGIWRYLFILVGAGALLGTIVHGVVLPQFFEQMVWWLIYLFLDLSIVLFALAVIYDCIASTKGLFLLLLLAAVCYVPLVVYESFTIFIVYQLVVMLAALIVYGYLAISSRLVGAGWLFSGIMLMIIGAILQAIQNIQITVIWTFDHNSIYHIVSIIGMSFLFRGLRLDLTGHKT